MERVLEKPLDYKIEEITYWMFKNNRRHQYINNTKKGVDESTKDLILNILDNIPFKPIVAQECKESTLTVETPIFSVIDHFLASKNMQVFVLGREVKEAEVALIESFKFQLIIVKPSQSNIDKSRILKF